MILISAVALAIGLSPGLNAPGGHGIEQSPFFHER